MYEEGLSVREASERTVHYMSSRLEGKVNPETVILDLGSGYGGASRKLAKKFNCKVLSLNVSEVQNERNRKANEEQGLTDKVEVIGAFFENVPLQDASVDIVWCEDAILHSHDKPSVIREISRVLKPGGLLIFHDPMKKDGVEKDQITETLNRLQLDDMASPAYYKELAEGNGLHFEWEIDLTEHAATHYQRIHDEIVGREPAIYDFCSEAFCSRMKQGLQHWITGFNNGLLHWGMMEFTKTRA